MSYMQISKEEGEEILATIERIKAQRDQLAEALKVMLAEYAAMSLIQKPNGAFVRAADKARAALAAVKEE